jgi:hypothetical protein
LCDLRCATNPDRSGSRASTSSRKETGGSGIICVAYVREFLNAFEKSRKENRELASNPSTAAAADNELLTFDRFNRSTDDERSHLERYRTLAKRFRDYLAKSKK